MTNHRVTAARFLEFRASRSATPSTQKREPARDQHLQIIQAAVAHTDHTIRLVMRFRRRGIHLREMDIDGKRCAVHPIRKPDGPYGRAWFDPWRIDLYPGGHFILIDVEKMGILRLYHLHARDLRRLFFDGKSPEKRFMIRITLTGPDPLEEFRLDWPLERPTPPAC